MPEKKLKVLWFTNTPANADEYFNSELKGTGGWIKSLNQLMQHEVELHIAFHNGNINNEPFQYQETKYYPIQVYKNKYQKKIYKSFNKVIDDDLLLKYLDVINQIKPDIIHIHGTENSFGNIIDKTDIPVIISIQGNLTVYHHKYLSGFGKEYLKVAKRDIGNPKSMLSPQRFINVYNEFRINAKRERDFLRNTKYIIGRTDWDRRITRILAPESSYFHNDEILRDSFYNKKWIAPEQNKKLIIHTTNGNNIYKGFETLCHALSLLNRMGINCEWRVAGIKEDDLIVKITKKKLKIDFPERGLVLLGSLNENELVDRLLEAHMYVMVSHIENSPNNLCEAMMLGMPCISTFVGGTGSLIKDKENGILIQDGDPWAMAGAILELKNDKNKIKIYGENAKETAAKRHDKENIIKDLVEIYTSIISKAK